jgi:hypothetical protein
MDVERADSNSIGYYDGNRSAIQALKNAGHGTNEIVFE